MIRRAATLALLLLPTAVAAGWAVGLGLGRAEEPAMRVAIRGYDPRDLLRGNYLEFRLDLEGDAECGCLVAGGADPLRPRVEPARCEAPPPACPHFVRGARRAYRYYAPEGRALAIQSALAARPGAASVVVHFGADGRLGFSGIQAGEAP